MWCFVSQLSIRGASSPASFSFSWEPSDVYFYNLVPLTLFMACHFHSNVYNEIVNIVSLVMHHIFLLKVSLHCTFSNYVEPPNMNFHYFPGHILIVSLKGHFSGK